MSDTQLNKISQITVPNEKGEEETYELENTTYSPSANFFPDGNLEFGLTNDLGETEYATVQNIAVDPRGHLYIDIEPSEGLKFETNEDGTATVINIGSFSGTELVIPSKYQGCLVTAIGREAFSKETITSVVIPDTVKSIGDYAFADCEVLNTIRLSAGVTSIGICSFSSCKAVQNIVIPDSVTSIGSSAFSDCYSLTSIIIPDSATNISDNVFNSCYGLTSVVIPDSVTTIGDYAFYGCDSLTVYCEHKSKPETWDEDWNCGRPVVWGFAKDSVSINEKIGTKANSMKAADILRIEKYANSTTRPFSQNLYNNFIAKERVYVESGSHGGVYPMYNLNPQGARVYNPWGSYTKPTTGAEGVDYMSETMEDGKIAYFSALSSVAQRQPDGNIRVNKTPVNSQDATSKAYVDSIKNAINADINKWTPKKVSTSGVVVKNSETISTIPYSASANAGSDENTLVRRRADRGILIELATNNDGSINSQSAINAKYLNERLQGASASEVYSSNYWTIPLRSITGEIKCECSDTSTTKASVNKEYLTNKLTGILDQVGEAYNQANLAIGAANDAIQTADTAIQAAYQADNLATRVSDDISQIQTNISAIEIQIEHNFQDLMAEIEAIKYQIGMSS